MCDFIKKISIIALTLLVGACAVPQKPEQKAIQETIHKDLQHDIAWWDEDKPPKAVQETIDKRLSEPLTWNNAQQIALLASYDIQLILAELGASYGQAMQQSLLSNPFIETVIIPEEEGVAQEFELRWDIASLFSLPSQQDRAEAQIAFAKQQTIAKIYKSLYSLYMQWLDAIALGQQLGIEERSMEAIEAAFLSAQEMHRVGNITDLQLYETQITMQLAALRLNQLTLNTQNAQERLALMLGVDKSALNLPLTLPKISSTAANTVHFTQQALDNNLQMKQIIQLENSIEAALSKHSVDRGIPDLEVGAVYEKTPDSDAEIGGIVEYTIPIFDTGAHKKAVLTHQLRALKIRKNQLKNRILTTSFAAQRELENARATMEKLLDEVTPIQIGIETESLKFYNAMQIGVFKLLNAFKQGNEKRLGFVALLKQYWISRGTLESIRLGILPEQNMVRVPTAQAAEDEGGH